MGLGFLWSFLKVWVLACVFLIIGVVALNFLIAEFFGRVYFWGIVPSSSHWGCFLGLTLGAWWFLKLKAFHGRILY